MAIDIFKPQISVLTKGLVGKIVMIYGTNRTGKTLNSVKAEKPYVVGFERGLNAIPGVPFSPITKWRDWTDTVKQLTGPTMAKAKELYQTIIIDTADSMGDLAADQICSVFNCDSVGSGNKGFGYWKEYGAEIGKWIRMLANSGYTVIFIAHEGERDFIDEKGAKYSKVYPRGEKRVIDPMTDLSDYICYAQIQPHSVKGEAVNSTLYMVGNRSFHAGSRFEVVSHIPEWNMEKLEKVIADSVALEEKKAGIKAVAYEVAKQSEVEAEKSKWDDISTKELIALTVAKGQKTIEDTGSHELYQTILIDELGNRDFKASAATEQQRPLLEQLLDVLEAKGY